MAESDTNVVPGLPEYLRERSTDLASWQSLLTDSMLPGHVQTSTALAIGELGVSRLLGGGAIAFLSVAPQEIVHRHDHLPRDKQEGLLIHIVLDGIGEIEQDGVRLRFGPGDISFRSTARPSSVRFDEAARLVALRVPRERLDGQMGIIGAIGPRVCAHDSRFARVVHTFVEQLVPCFFEASFEPVAALEQSLLMLLATTYCVTRAPALPAAPRRLATERRWQTLVAHIDAQLSQTELSPASCARALNLSTRSVYALFAERQLRFSHYVLDKRLELGRMQLEDARLARMSIAALAYRCGFANAAHFSRVFTHRYGMPPGQWRRMSRAGT
ncbi:helix-turn-helix domain-containing protein [Pararobbsia silviterrae]|uniref:Helix-turn-helix domain-containing protein n=1 Tax=Pararobbsia silviterrae TaxID=1792498 RepID=A0A494XW12_9BURK|nr:helix-turn-helix domain-containing protein [Pararobbsia silviterrae]RKP51783.1 helix-turn-helix domain-containing protein [Pararobbsia silviterrae]